MTDGDASCVRDRAPNIVSATVVIMLPCIDSCDNGLSVRSIVRLDRSCMGRGWRGEDGRRESEGVQVCTLSCVTSVSESSCARL